MTETSTAVVAMTTDAAQTANRHATLTATAQDSQSVTHGEATPTTTTTRTTTGEEGGGPMETMIGIEEKTGLGTIVVKRRTEDGEGTRAALEETADT